MKPTATHCIMLTKAKQSHVALQNLELLISKRRTAFKYRFRNYKSRVGFLTKYLMKLLHSNYP